MAQQWKNLKGMRRVQAEFKHLSADIKAKKFGFIKELTLPTDDMLVWQLKLHHFDDDLPGGRQLNEDLARLKQQYGQDHLVMQIEFPQDYPYKPFFVRLVSPRCRMYTGHVTAGGSICLEALTLSGTPGSWQPDFSVESLMNIIMINMIDCPVTFVQTTTGPGGRTGPLRIDFTGGNPTIGYSSAEALAAFHRTLLNHQRLGWGQGAADPAGGQQSAGSRGAAAAAAAAGGAAAAAGAGAPGAGLRHFRLPPAAAAAAAAAVAGSRGAAAAAAAAGGAAAAAGDATGAGLRHYRLPPAADAAAAAAAAAGAVDGAPPAWASGNQQQQQQPQPRHRSSTDVAGQNQHAVVNDRAPGAVAPAGWDPAAAAAAGRAYLSRTGTAAAAAGQHAAAADDTAPSRKRPRPNAAAAAAAAGAGGGAGGSSQDPVIDLCSDDDRTSSDMPVVVGIVNAPPGSRQQQQHDQQQDDQQQQQQENKKRKATRSNPLVISMDSDTDDDSVKIQSVNINRHNRTARRTQQQQQQQQQEDDQEVTSQAQSGVRRHALQRAAAQAARQGLSPTHGGRHAAAAAGAAAPSGGAAVLAKVAAAKAAFAARAAAATAAAAAAAGQGHDPHQRSARRSGSSSHAARQGAAAAAAGAGGRAGTGAAAAGAPQAPRGQPRPHHKHHHQRGVTGELPPHPEVAAVVQEQMVLDGGNGAPKVQLELELPTHWDYSVALQRNTARLVELPLPHQPSAAGPPTDPLEAAALAAGLDEGVVGLLVQQGLSRPDALAALLLEDNGSSADDAMMRAVTCLELGGAAKVWGDMQPVQVVNDVLHAAEVAAHRRRLADEAEGILKRLESTGGGMQLRNKVVRIERVQHPKLWRRYALRRAEMEEERSRQGLNERLLFHGTSAGTADRIAHEGFDVRLVNVAAYGNGIYFADHSSTAYSYCAKPDNVHAAAGGFAGAGIPASMLGVMAAGMMPPGAAGAAAAWAQGARQQGRGVYKMIVARVALGRQTQGASGMRRPPDGFDSVHSGAAGVPNLRAGQQAQGQYCHVVFDNDQCYPEYLVTLQP